MVYQVLKDYAAVTVEAMMNVLTTDNEDNAVLAIKIMADIHKNNRQLLNFVQPFFDFVVTVYSNFQRTMAKYFKIGPHETTGDDVHMSDTTSTHDDDDDSNKKKKRLVANSTESCKVLIEVPQLLIFLIQYYPDVAKKNLKVLAPKMVESFSVSVKPPSHSNQFRQQYLDLVAARVKVST